MRILFLKSHEILKCDECSVIHEFRLEVLSVMVSPIPGEPKGKHIRLPTHK